MHVGVIILASRMHQVPEAARAVVLQHGLPVLIATDPMQPYASTVQQALARAADAGWTHAITLDIDQQHAPDDLPAFIAAIERQPTAIISGVRQLPRGIVPLGVKLCATICDFWIWTATGRWTWDCAHAYRAYPLADIRAIYCTAKGHEFELEVLAKSIWCGLPTAQLPVCVAGKFRLQIIPPTAFIRYGAMITSLIARRLLLPTPLLGAIYRGHYNGLSWGGRLWQITKQVVAHHCQQPRKFAIAVGLGVFFGVCPAWGFQMILAATTAHLLRVSKAVAVAASGISSPLTIPILLYASLLIGHGLVGGTWASLPARSDLSREVIARFLGEYLFGSIVLATALGLIASTIAYGIAKVLRRTQSGRATAAIETL